MAEDTGTAHEAQFEVTCTSLASHPRNASLTALGFVDGVVKIVDHASGLKDRITMQNEQDSLTCIAFTQDGISLATGSRQQKSLKICSFETGKIILTRDDFTDGLQSVYSYDENLLAVSDCKKSFEILDLRQPLTEPVFKNSDHADYISSFLGQPSKNRLFSFGSAGQLAAWDLRNMKLWAASEEIEDELVCGALLKHGNRLLVGCESSQIAVFKTEHYTTPCHCIPGHPDSIDQMISFDEDTVITGCGDGFIRMITCEPTKMLGIVGNHGDFPILDMALSSDKRWLLSTSFDDVVKVWDLQEEKEQQEAVERPRKKRKKNGKTLFEVDKKKEALEDFFSDL